MTAISKFIVAFAANLTGLFISAYFVPEMELSKDISGILTIVFTITVVNLTIRPLIKLVLSPLIFITLGLFAVLINAALLYVIDIYSPYITINGPWPIIEASHIVTIINIVINYAALYLYRGSDIS